MSKKYSIVKDYYDRKLWSETRVRNAVKKGWITEEECEKILNGDEPEEKEGTEGEETEKE